MPFYDPRIVVARDNMRCKKNNNNNNNKKYQNLQQFRCQRGVAVVYYTIYFAERREIKYTHIRIYYVKQEDSITCVVGSNHNSQRRLIRRKFYGRRAKRVTLANGICRRSITRTLINVQKPRVCVAFHLLFYSRLQRLTRRNAILIMRQTSC
jgi:hypothetical protein